MGERLKARMKETGARLKEQGKTVLDWVQQHPLHALAVIGLIVVIYFLFWKIPVWQLENLRADHPDKLYELKAIIRGNLIQAFGVIFLVIGIYFAWRRLEVAQEGQITVPFR